MRSSRIGLNEPAAVLSGVLAPAAGRNHDIVTQSTDVPIKTDLRTGHIAFPDAFRATAIGAVLAAHLGGYGTTSHVFAFLGTWGVDCFFVLSGFLLSGPYLRAALNAGQTLPSSRAFWIRRILRIYPLYAVCVVVSAIPPLLHHGISTGNIVAHLTMTHGFFIPYARASFNVPLWTMAVDAQFYAVLPIAGLAVVAMCRNRGQTWRRRTVWATIVAAIVLSITERAIVYAHLPHGQDSSDAAIVYARNVIGMAPAFALGSAITFANQIFGRPGRATATWVTSAGLVLLLVLALSGTEASNVMAVQIFDDLIGALSAAALLYGLGEGPFPAVQRFTSLPFIASAATLAYGVYLFHKPVTFIGVRLLGTHLHRGSPLYGLAMTAITLPIAVVIAYFGNRFIEEPFLRIKDRYREKRTPEGRAVEGFAPHLA